MAKFGDKPGSVLVDMGQFAVAPDKRYPFLVSTGPHTTDCKKNGIPSDNEISNMEQALDATSGFLTGITAKVLVGTLTYNCERLNYYYVKDTAGIRNAIMRMYKRSFPHYDFAVNIKYDPTWSTYLTFLYPSDETKNWMENTRIITQLLQTGDSLKKKRDISFIACFPTDTARDAFSGFVANAGYTVRKTNTLKRVEQGQCITFSRFGPVQIDTLCAQTTRLKTEVKKHNGFYAGWDATLR